MRFPKGLKFLFLLLSAIFLLAVLLVSALLFWLVYLYKNPPPPQVCSSYLSKTEVEINGRHFVIPAEKGLTLRFAQSEVNPSANTFVRTENDVPWEHKTRGFCAEEVIGRPNPISVLIERSPIKNILKELDFPPEGDVIYKLGFGVTGLGSWLNPNPIREGSGNPNHLIQTREFNDILNLQSMETAGWLDDKYRISSRCIEYETSAGMKCNVRITMQSDRMIYEAWGVQIAKWPEENRPPPATFLEIARKLPRIAELFEKH